nr:phospholipase D gamma 1-like [Tanacetum cinerariifolium]
MTYDRIHKALQELGLENVYEPQDYLIFFCLGIRKSPHGVEPTLNEKASNAANSPLSFTWKKSMFHDIRALNMNDSG